VVVDPGALDPMRRPCGRARERMWLVAERDVERTEVQVAEVWRSVEQGTGLVVERRAATIDRAAQAVALNSTRHLELLLSLLDQDRERVARAVGHRVTLASCQLGDAVAQLARAAEAVRRDAGTRIESFVQRIVGLGPEATLRRGYAIVRDRDGRPLGTRRRAEVEPVLQLEFQGGRMRVENKSVATEPRS
jgi:exodeoxyribonuclease VII large subunit